MARKPVVVGIDVAKAKVDACIRSLGQRCCHPSTPEGIAAMVTWLKAHRVTLAVMEASGGQERRWAQALREAGIEARIVDPKRVRHFAKSAGQLAKNDPIDAEMIAWFAETFDLGVSQPHDPAREELDVLVTARAGIDKLLTQLEQRNEHCPPPAVAKAMAVIAKAMRLQIARLDALIDHKIADNPAFARRAEIIDSVPGLSSRSVASLIAWFPELGQISNKEAAALIGVAPYDDDSGKRKGARHIKGGRRELRNALYMPIVGAATQHNPVLKAFHARLVAKGKEGKVVLIACMHKLIVILNTMLARNQTWNPPSRPMAVAIPATA